MRTSAETLHNQNPISSRRNLLRSTACGFGSMAWAAMLGQPSDRAEANDRPLSLKPAHFPAKAKRVIFFVYVRWPEPGGFV